MIEPDVDLRCFVCGRRAGKGFFSLGSGLYICRFCNGGDDLKV